MKDVNKIKQLLEKNEITFEQSKILFESFKESEKYENSLSEQIEFHRHKREKNIWWILAIWSFLLVVSLGLLIISSNTKDLSSKTVRALKETNFAVIYLAKGDYEDAIDQVKKSISIDPDFSLGYSLLALTNKVLYHETGKKEYLDGSTKAMDSLRAMIVKNDIKKFSGGNSLLPLIIFIVLIMSTIKILSIIIYSILIRKEEKANKAWMQTAVFYLRKLDLIQALMEPLKDYSAHEMEALKTVLIATAQAKEKLTSLNIISGNKSEQLKGIIGEHTPVESSLRDVYTFVERFPKISMDKKYASIKNEIDETEKSFYKSVERYNTRVGAYNSILHSFPFTLIAGKFGFIKKADINFKD